MNKKTNIWVTFRKEGIHKYPAALRLLTLTMKSKNAILKECLKIWKNT